VASSQRRNFSGSVTRSEPAVVVDECVREASIWIHRRNEDAPQHPLVFALEMTEQ